MGTYQEPPRLRLLEPVPILPVYCDALGLVELVAGQMHFVLYIHQPCVCPETDEPFERIVNLRVVMPPEGVAAALPVVARKLASMAAGKVREATWRMFAS